MEGQDGDSAAARRWTCDACGCNTNESTDRTCSICGTSNAGPAVLRRAGAGYAARAGWLARGLGGARRGIMNDDFAGLDDEDLWESVVDGVEMAGDDPENAMESLAMEVSGMASAARNARMESSRHSSLENASRQRFLEAARAFSQANRDIQRADPDELLRWATENAASYHPRWANPAQLVASRNRSGNEIEVGEGERQNLAHLPAGSGTGRAIRTDEPVPRDDSFGSFSYSSPSNVSQDQRQRRAFGFRVAFDHPAREPGASMGGCYLIGVTTASFTAFGEQNSLQQSPFFWGIEDSSQKYEGSRYNPAGGRGGRRGPNSSHGVELSPQDAPMNSADVLFGSREVVTVVCDFEARTLTFWRDETLLGTLVTNLPRSGALYPVAVPFNCGVTVAITGMDNDPLPLLRTFATDWRKVQQDKDETLRCTLKSQRAVLIEDGMPTPRLVSVLKTIFVQYKEEESNSTTDAELTLDYTAASRLWYRCGMKLSCLDAMLEEKSSSPSLPLITFEDFLAVIEKIVEEDETVFESAPSKDETPDTICEVGDKVELVNGYEKYGDASGGPLQPGDRGTVVELQRGPNGERRSVRALFNGRRWWYQPQAVMSERSLLIESPGVWFLRKILRSHSYDHIDLESLVGKQVTSSSWCFGDVVIPKKTGKDTVSESAENSMGACFGRIVAEPSTAAPSLVSHSRDVGTVAVEFVNRSFAKATGVVVRSSSESFAVLDSRRMRASKLLHSSTLYDGHKSVSRQPIGENEVPREATEDFMEADDASDSKVESDKNCPKSSVTDKARSELIALSRLERSAIESVRKECQRNPDSLASLFSAGLPDSILAAIDVGEKQMNSLEPREDLTEKISAVGELALLVADQLFSPSQGKRLLDAEADETTANQYEPASRSSMAGTDRLSHHSRRLSQEAAIRREVRRQEERTSDPQGAGASLQQRRSMLLSLMTRARRSNTSYINEIMDRSNGGLARDFPLEQIAPPLGFMRGGQAFAGSGPGDFAQDQGWDDPSFGGAAAQAEDSNGFSDEGASSPGQAQSVGDQPKTYLDTILRCRGDRISSGSHKDSGAAHTAFTRHLVSTGVLVDSLAWVKASVDSQMKKTQLPSLQKSSAVLRNAVDEEGTPLLQLAISFGCSAEVIDFLVLCGCSIGETEIKKAAVTNQPRILSQLLKHASFSEGTVDPKACSPAVAQVFAQAKVRQDDLATNMREAAGAFMVRLLRRLLVVGLSSRRHSSSRVDLCSKAISDLLVGNVLLRALQCTQKAASGSSERETLGEQDPCDRSGRYPVNNTYSDVSRTAQGLLGCLPQTIIAEALLLDLKYTTTFFLLVEDYLSSKDMDDAAAGLTFLATFMRRVPALRACAEMDRYGVGELVSFHDVLASSRLADITARQSETEHNASPPGDAVSNVPRHSVSEMAPDISGAVVACPKRHTAVLHITRHSSFRCDLCGNGVERGRPMYGCRECDWDACENCTDRAESGVVKCNAIRELTSECRELLSVGVLLEELEGPDFKVIEKLTGNDNSAELNSLSIRLLERDVSAVEELASMLTSPGRVTMHQFLTVILPALHASLTGRSPGNDSSQELRVGSGRRSKKARVIGGDRCDNDDAAMDSPEDRVAFCKDIVRVMFLKPSVEKVSAKEETKPELQDPTDDEDDHEDTEVMEDVENSGRRSSDLDVLIETSELLRRLQQILSSFENVTVLSSSPDRKDGAPAGSQGADLQALTKPIEVHLYPSAFGESGATSNPRLVVHAEPLVQIADLELHVLRTCKLNNISYDEFCRRLACDKTIIVEKAAKSHVWQLARVVDYDETTGVHWVQYATRWNQGQDRRLVRVRKGCSDELGALCFDGPETKVSLAASEYFVLRRASEGSTDLCEPNVSPGPRTIVSSSLRDAVGRQASNDFDSSNALPFMSARQRSDMLRMDANRSSGVQRPAALKRTWSAISLAESMRAVELSVPDNAEAVADAGSTGSASFKCKIGDSDVVLVAESQAAVEIPPRLRVAFATHEKFPGMGASPLGNKTLVGALKSLHKRHNKLNEWSLKRSHKLFFSVSTSNEMPSVPAEDSDILLQRPTKTQGTHPPSHFFLSNASTKQSFSWSHQQESRSRKLSSQSPVNDDDDEAPVGLCEGLDEISIQCMEVISLLSEIVEDSSIPIDKDQQIESAFANATLSKKLIEQLDDSVSVVGGTLPDWCTAAPSFAPRVFSYESRRMLLERVAFGVSRSTLKQQESKINVGRLRQRMAALRGRAVELVGEAFSGGAEDPTALQLQADELYGMEEALAARVRAAFRAVKWQEHSLQVAKGAVNRDKLVSDAAAVMERYANDDSLSRRRLEVRFYGESGFDAASGDEAGVTRGFYADVAEALISCEHVAGVYCSNSCSYVSPTASLDKVQPMDIDEMHKEASKLPLWIPDMDSSAQVVIPTPRADKQSGLGVYPRPLPRYHPQTADVLLRFRFIGRLFAAAMRDGFMFPLPLSSAFLELAQHGADTSMANGVGREASFSARSILLTSSDLPRPGFLGGEVYAAEAHICKALDRLDAMDTPLSTLELQKQYNEIATDQNFARAALGKSYDCSFEDYFQDRTFVDPLDPTQGEDAAPLCPGGHKKMVTIYNVREWVDLAKNFILHEGVIAQALAFRKGVEDFFVADYLRLFTSEELQRDVCGLGDDVDDWDESAVRKLLKLDGGKGAAEALVAVAAIGGEGGAALSRRFGPTSPTIIYLVKALLEASAKQRRQFLSFVTSLPIVTPGKIEVVPMVSPTGEFLPMQDPSCLPRTNTCARRLYLPKFETFESFSEVLWAVVREESRFKGFYEWRG